MMFKRDPNYYFKYRKKDGKQPYGSPRPDQSVLMIRCDATNCGHKTLISRAVWLGREEIQCSNCGETKLWSTL